MKRASLFAILILCSLAPLLAVENSGREVIPLSGQGWSLWQDEQAAWQDDTLYLPGEAQDLSTLPVNPPTGGWEALGRVNAKAVSVPGTVEEYLQTSDYPNPRAFAGVGWWYRPLSVPAKLAGKKFILRFESVRQRAEVYLDGKLVAYDVVGESPFEADVTAAVQPGKIQTLAVRVTNAGGNYHWQDFDLMTWGKYSIPPGRGFGGIIGRVNLVAAQPVFISDLSIQNTPEIRQIHAIVTVRNLTGVPVQRNVKLRVVGPGDSKIELAQTQLENVSLPAGETVVKLDLNAPKAKLWDLETPNLYQSEVSLSEGTSIQDREEKSFGFRWFAPEDVGKNAVFRLNGRRIVLRSAISWGYWPTTGLIATPEMAHRQVATAKALGLNMLNFHRSIGIPVVLEAADSMGLLYFEEPGAFFSATDDFSRAIVNEKLARMIRRDRSHPSLIIYNLINEFGGKKAEDKELNAKRMEDMQRAHAVDPSRTMTFTSGWAHKKDAEEDAKAHMRPYDDVLHRNGWFDNHRAGGPETWTEAFYKSPTENLMATKVDTEIFMRGEEGALSTPPRIQKIHDELQRQTKRGWDGLFWDKQYQAFAGMFESKGLKPYFSSLDGLTEAMGNISFEHQGRRIEGMRMQNLGDSYVINGWESMPFDNHSGIVDIFRNPKGTPAILSYYNQPVYVAVTPRAQVVRLPGEVAVDFWAVNEVGLHGPYTLRIVAETPDGKEIFHEDRHVDLKGGETYGQLLVENVAVPLRSTPGGLFAVRASLLDAEGKERAKGRDRVLGVDWKPESLAGKGAVYGNGSGGDVATFFKQQTGRDLPIFDGTQEKLDWIIVKRPPLDAPRTIEPGVFRTVDGKPGLSATFYPDDAWKNPFGQRTDAKIDFDFAEGAQADASVAANQAFATVWEGNLVPPVSGQYLLEVVSDAKVRLFVNGQRLIDDWSNGKMISNQRTVTLESGKPASIRLEYWQQGHKGTVSFRWSKPGDSAMDPAVLFERAKRDGTTLLILDSAENWLEAISRNTAVRNQGSFTVGVNWVGGVFFVREHPLFRDLPVNVGMDWPYQAVVRDGEHRIGLRLEGEELVAGAYKSFPFNLGTAVGVIPCGKGQIVVSTLDILSNLNELTGPAEVARKLLSNYIGFAMEHRSSVAR